MRLSQALHLRRIVNSSYDPFHVIPKPDVWMKRERLNRFTAWQYASERTTVKGAHRKLDKTFHYLDMQRKDEPRLEKHYAQERLEAALAEHDLPYGPFKNILSRSHILLDNVVLSQLAIYEPQTFKVLVDSNILEEPLPRAQQFPRGASQNHKIKPRKLKPEEF